VLVIKYFQDYIILVKEALEKYSMHLFGIVAFIFTFSMGIIALFNHSEILTIWIPTGILVFLLNLFYIKLIRISRQDYENSLKEEKEYSQSLLKRQKIFLRSVIHETNTPLAVIMANIELFEHEHGKDPSLSNIEAATKNIFGIYDDLSYLTRKDKIIYHKQNINLAEFIQSRIEFFEIVALQSKLTIVFKNHSKDTTIMINETKLQRIVDNNITNAIKYTQSSELIEIQLHDHQEHRNQSFRYNTIFEISSTSTIIKEPEQVFHAYYRENYDKEGLGIGLNLVKRICDEEDIMIELTSKKEKTSFKYYFKKDMFENITT